MMNMSSFRVMKCSLALTGCLLALAGCGQKSGRPNSSAQWVAKVDGHEITVHQVNAELRGGGAALEPEVAQRRAIETLVDRRLLMDAAVKAEQDRDPDVMQAVEKAKEQTIAQAYLRKMVGSQAKPAEKEVTAYFNDHPELFAKREQYEMRQIVIDGALITDELKKAVDAARSLQDVENVLVAKNLQFTKDRSTPTSDELPSPILKNVNALVSGKPFVIRTASNVVVATLSVLKDVPLSLQEAAPQIERYLINARIQESIAAEIARLRKQARVEYKDARKPVPLNGPGVKDAVTEQHVAQGAAGLR